MNTLLTLDYRIFTAVNHLPHPVWADTLAGFCSGLGSYGFIWFVAGFVLFLREEVRNHRFVVSAAITATTALASSEWILKPVVARLRPSVLPETVVVAPALGYSFPSTHATVSFAMAELLSAYEPGLRIWWYGLAVVISLSRLYLGVHYPSDVVIGACIGWVLARLIMQILPVRVKSKIRPRHSSGRRR